MGRYLVFLMMALLVGCGKAPVQNRPATGATPQEAVMAQSFTQLQRSTLRIVSDQEVKEDLHFVLYRYQDGPSAWLAYRQVMWRDDAWWVGDGGGMTLGIIGEAPHPLDYSLIPIANTDSSHSVMYGLRHEPTLSRFLFWFKDGTQEVVEVESDNLLYAFEGKEICGFLGLDDAKGILIEELQSDPQVKGCPPQPDLEALDDARP